jgi:hypothetical protein
MENFEFETEEPTKTVEPQKEKKKWTVHTKEFIFAYLTISKLWYFFNMFATMESISADIVIPALITRFLTWDLPIIFTVGAFYIIDIFKIRDRYKYLIHYFVLMGAYQMVALNLVGEIYLGLAFLIPYTISYAIIVGVLLIKEHFKNKLKD